MLLQLPIRKAHLQKEYFPSCGLNFHSFLILQSPYKTQRMTRNKADFKSLKQSLSLISLILGFRIPEFCFALYCKQGRCVMLISECLFIEAQLYLNWCFTPSRFQPMIQSIVEMRWPYWCVIALGFAYVKKSPSTSMCSSSGRRIVSSITERRLRSFSIPCLSRNFSKIFLPFRSSACLP